MIISTFLFVFGGEPHVSLDGEALEGVGETRWTTGTIFTDKPFTGQRDTGLGIYDYNARMYDPKLGRFLSADTIVQNFANPQSLNRFSYTLNNPLRYTDPTGHVIPCEEGDVCGSGSGTTGSGSSSGSSNNNNNNNNNDDGDPSPDPNPNGVSGNYCAPGELVCQLQEDGYVETENYPVDSIAYNAFQGDTGAMWDLVLPTEFGWRLQLEICGKLMFGQCGSIGANIVFNRSSDEIASFIDVSPTVGQGEGGGASLTTGPLVGWFASDTNHLTSGLSSTSGGTLAYEGSVSVSASSPLTIDKKYGAAPMLYYVGGGVGYAYYGVGTGGSGNILSGTIRLP